jgi:DNA mismatch repair protein MutL
MNGFSPLADTGQSLSNPLVDRRPIKQLPASLVNRIAAGEVIERPASVVKELIENALDAGAKSIVVEIQDGGRELIRVIDDGQGIPTDELPLAFASHATSKLTDDEDLFRISTMGFRGEALASIASVSQTRIVSRPAVQPLAHALTSDGGQLGDVQAAPGNSGTVVEVRNLFFNTPARRKFLRGTATEFGHIGQTVLRLAIPFPNISFRVLHNGRQTLDLPVTNPQDRLLAAWPSEFRQRPLPIDQRIGDLWLRGIVGQPEMARPTPVHQFLYVNNRYIRDRFLGHALREAFRGLTEPGRHPAAVLLLSIPPGEVDVNVHPTKSEVRFRDGGRLHSIFHGAVRERLIASDLTPAALPTPVDVRDEQRQHLQQKLAEFFSSVPEQAALPSTFVSQSAPISAMPAPMPPIEAPSGAPLPAPRVPAIQLHNSYLVVESNDGLLIIDQHALHERILYEDLLARVSSGPLESQRLLIPAVLPASPAQIELLEQVRPLLARLGIEAESFGPASLAIQAFPSFLERLDPAIFVAELLERGQQELLDLTQEELLHEILDMMSCKAAVKAGDPLSPTEIQALLDRRQLIERSSNCPHGRPTMLRMTLRDLEKQFKRTGF